MVALMFGIVAFIPIILAYFIHKSYSNFISSKLIVLFLICIGIWEIGGATLYDTSISQPIMLWLFRILRIGCTIAPAIFLHICYQLIMKNARFKTALGQSIYKLIVNRYTTFAVYAWSTFVFLLDLTNYGETSMVIIKGQLEHYFPVYGSLSILFKLQSVIFLLILIVSTIGVSRIEHKKMKTFMYTFNTSTLLLLISAAFCFVFNGGPMLNMISIILFSIAVTFSFVNLYNDVLNDYNILIERQNKLDHVGNMTSSLMHEVKNSVMIIQGCAKLIPSMVQLEGSSKEMLDCIIDASSQLTTLVKSYSDFFKNDEKALHFQRKNVENVVLKAQKYVKRLFCNSTLHFTLEKRGNVQAYIDENYLNQVFVNLFKNSFEAMDKSKIDKRIDVILYSSGEYLVIDVKDNGNGIPADCLNKIFTPFNSSKDHGMGLGLTFCYKVIYSHRGSIKVVSSNSNGTHIQVQIPKYRATDMLVAQ